MNLQSFPAQLADVTPFQAFATMTVTSEVDAGYVTDRRQEVKDRLKEIEKTRKSFTEPLVESKRRIDDQAKAISAPLEAIVRVLDSKLIEWHKSQQEIREAEARKAREAEAARLEAQKKADLEAAMITGDEQAIENVIQTEKMIDRLQAKPIEVQNNTRTAKATSYLQETWAFEVVDAAKVPREFLLVDEVKLRKYALAMKDDAKVEGVRFFKKSTIGSRR